MLNILTARGDIDLEKLKFAVYDFTSMYTKFTHKMIMTQMTKLLTYVYRRQAVVLGGDTAYLFVPHHQDYQRLASFWSNVTFHQGAWSFLLVFCSAEPSNAESLLLRAYILAPAASASP